MDHYLERAAHAWTTDSVRIIATPSVFARTSLYYVQEVGRFLTLPGYYTERHRLHSYLIVYTVSGTGGLTYKDKSYTLLPGQLFFIDCMEYQYYATDPDDPWELLWVHASGSAIRGYYDQFQVENNPVLTLPSDSLIPTFLTQLIEVHRRFSYRSELIASKLIVELLTELLLTAKEQDLPDTGMPVYVREAVALMERHYGTRITLDEFARRCKVSKYHLAKEFKRHIGLSPNEYLIHIRISRAKELLKYSEQSVAAIASQVGIENVSHFINLFKNRVSYTPLAYRRRWNQPTLE